ncbi:Clp protease N-terminal domain-containing protein [Actinomadura sp. 21ATH]|uniref:Clp protease N-terminal domain-containing protein n=1 Tax=Actinomadura sp. 21ATH TaxID=1735444 RepID=UPI0035BF79DB
MALKTEAVMRFTRQLRMALVRAQNEARALSRPAIGTEHLLLGMYETGTAATVLAEHGLQPDAVRAAAARRAPAAPPGSAPQGHLGWTGNAAQALDLFEQYSLRFGSPDAIDSGHALLALTHDGFTSAQVLADLGVDIAAFRSAVSRKLIVNAPVPPGQGAEPGAV